MKTIEIESIGKMSSLDVGCLIFFWKVYDPNSVMIAYSDLIKEVILSQGIYTVK